MFHLAMLLVDFYRPKVYLETRAGNHIST